MESPKVSIVIPFYTKEWFNLDITLESIFNQTYKNIEIIIVDDNSL
ncbi:glycosyltransferase [Providencia rettgeri]|nr:glycosyltransferase [Providencia rettgeri]